MSVKVQFSVKVQIFSFYSTKTYVVGTICLAIFFSVKSHIIFLSISLSMSFGCSKEPSHRDGSFEYPQHMIWLRNKGGNSEKIMVYLESWNGLQMLSERGIMVQKEVRACFRAPDNDIENNCDRK